MNDTTPIIPIDRSKTVDTFAALSVQVDALARSVDGDDNGIFTITWNGSLYPFIGDRDIWHIWEDAILIAALKAIAAGADTPEIWATIALRAAALNYTRWYS